jgi:hypothetical protein
MTAPVMGSYAITLTEEKQHLPSHRSKAASHD